MEELARPTPPSSVGDRIRSWIDWFGLARLIGSAAAVLVVVGGAFWLLRSPPPSTEAFLPRASTTSSLPPSNPLGSEASVLPGQATQPGGSLDGKNLTVHVAGAVVAPGVYELDPDARVHTAIEAAGGATAEADPDALNLAELLVDGSRVYVPAVGEDVVVPPPLSPAAPGSTPDAVVDVNRAPLGVLETLPGIGPATAEAIVTERETGGPFLGVEDLDRVPGIGPAKIEALRGLVST